MALGIKYTCNSCGKSIKTWDEGDPYYRDDKGKKHYAYHPDPERELCTGIDSPHLCLGCGKEFMVDSEDPITVCPKCKSTEIADTFELEGLGCPFCKSGEFERDSNYSCIS